VIRVIMRPCGQLGHLEAPAPRPRSRRGPGPRRKDTGLRGFPFLLFAINAAWLELVLAATELIA
jgi:hypothetical protein